MKNWPTKHQLLFEQICLCIFLTNFAEVLTIALWHYQQVSRNIILSRLHITNSIHFLRWVYTVKVNLVKVGQTLTKMLFTLSKILIAVSGFWQEILIVLHDYQKAGD